MRWAPTQTAPKQISETQEQFGLSSFQAQWPKGGSHTQTVPSTAYADCFFTINNAGGSPGGNRLLRVTGTLAGQPISCLIDSGASHDFVSQSFVSKFKLADQVLKTTRRVRGYDGQVTAAGGTLVAPLLLSCPQLLDGALADSVTRRSFVVAQLHSDDVILGMPWLSELDAQVDFKAQRVRIPRASTGNEDHWMPLVELPVQKSEQRPPTTAAQSELLIHNITQLYTETDSSKQEQAAQRCALHELLSRTSERDGIAELAAAYDDRGRVTQLTAKQAVQQDAPPEAPELVSMREKLLKEFSDVFADSLPCGQPPGRGHELHIELVPGAKPPARVPPRINDKHSKFETKWLKDMLDKKLISKSQSQYAAPHFYVEKPETATTGEYRAVTDFRALNAVTVKNRYPLPRADQLFDKLTKAKYFTKIDLRTGFYQILINELDRHKTAFTTSQGLFEYNVLPMGLCNSPGVFMQLMNDTFADFLNKFVLVFLDDIIVYSNTLEEHEQHVRQALLRLRQQKLYAKASKSALCKREVEFLGHMVGVNGLRVMQDKIEAVQEWPKPKNIRELRAFLGLAGYYRRFVRNFSAIALPLTELTRNVTRQKLELSWGAKEQKAFVELQKALQSTPVLVLPDPAREFVVHCDASGYAVGAVLQQDHGKGLQPVAFMSKKMVGAETRYPVHEQELLAIVSALTTWRHYLEGATHPVRVRTDHKSLTHFQTQPMLSGRQQRWMETLSQFDYTVEYVKGQENQAADALSRRGDHLDKGAPSERPPAYVDPVRVTLQLKKAFELNKIMVLEDRSMMAEFNAMDAVMRRRADRGGRQEELQRIAQRAAADRSATEVIPLNEIAPNRPPPDAHGVRTTPTQRCTATNKKGGQCGSRTAKGRYCHVHMASKDGLRVKKSAIAGMGLFATRDFAIGENVADYTGDMLMLTHDKIGGEYALELTTRKAIDAARTNTAYGRYINDPRGSDLTANTEFVVNPARGTGRLRATVRISKGDEILVSYGAQYWRTYGHRAKLPVRPAADARRKQAAPAAAAAAAPPPAAQRRAPALAVGHGRKQAAGERLITVGRGIKRAVAARDIHEPIDLTEVSVSTFSSQLADAFEKACADDPAYAADLKKRRSDTPSDDLDTRAVVDEFIVRDGRLFHRTSGCLLVPADKALRTLLIRESHDAAMAGHFGRDKTIEQMQRRFTWTKMEQEVELYVKTCEQCQRNKPSQQRTPGLLMPIEPPNYQGHTWSMDYITQLPPCTRTGNDAIVVFVCKLTKLKHIVACKTDIDAPSTARLFLDGVVRLHGMPERIISDRDPRFTANFWQAFWAGLGTTLSMSTAYHPETDGQTENANRTLEIMLRSVINFEQDDWDDHLPAAELAMNNARNETTGFSPFYMFYGRDARLPLDLALAPLTKARANPSAADALARWRAALVRAQENTKTAQRRQKKYADEHRRALTFKVGDRVLLATANLKLVGEAKRARKFTERYIGPFRVKAVRNANAYELELPPSMRIHPTINISQLKEYHDGSAAFPTRPAPLTRPEPAAINNDGSPEWAVERILDHRRSGRKKTLQYLILWKGYAVHEATWERVEMLDGALELVVDYNVRKKIQLSSAEALEISEFTLERSLIHDQRQGAVRAA
jgi:hypothetical protein